MNKKRFLTMIHPRSETKLLGVLLGIIPVRVIADGNSAESHVL